MWRTERLGRIPDRSELLLGIGRRVLESDFDAYHQLLIRGELLDVPSSLSELPLNVAETG
jgi:hypothetical protein